MNVSRRNFLLGSAAVTGFSMFGGCSLFNGPVAKVARGQKIRLAVCGIMGKGFTDWLPMIQSGLAEIVAWCDADTAMRDKALGNMSQAKFQFPGFDFDKLSKVPFYTDYRQLLDNCARLGVHAMTVSTPDHTHAPVAIAAMKQGIHVYVQKPLVRTLWENDYFKRTAKEYGVVTQMGNQGSAADGMRRGVEVLRSGILGEVKEVHVWTNRPVWPQGKGAADATLGAADPIPAGFNWDAWLGPAKDRPFKGKYGEGKKGYDPWNLCSNVYHPFSWRGFLDFGCGAFGDMACHTMNLPFRGLELENITKAECKMIEDFNDIAYPMKSIVELTYAARDSKARPGVRLPEVKLTWWDGGNDKINHRPSPDLMPQVVASLGKVPVTGCLVVGSKGILCSTNDYGGQSFIALNDEKKVLDIFDHPACKDIPTTLPRCKKAADDDKNVAVSGGGAAAVSVDGHYTEFLTAILEQGPTFEETNSRCYSDVDFSIPIMEGILCGVVAQRIPMTVLNWNSKAQKFDSAQANALIRPYLRSGFTF